ncbi:MAG: beta-galactosidase trimerization domain-containing protein, partial [Rhodothermia bacterium]|nr:beta-galactosidase trimerization domain-containing protein [Rhodothermia bacterium]
ILYSPENQIFAWAATGSEKSATDSLLGTHRALYEHNFTIDFLHPSDFEAGVLSDYKVIVIPFPYLLSQVMCSKLREWVASGGTLIAESYFGAWNLEEGRHHTTIPGYGFHDVFGVRQKLAEPAAEHEFVSLQGLTRSIGSHRAGHGVSQDRQGHGFVWAQTVNAAPGLGRVEILPAQSLPHTALNEIVYGAKVKEILEVDDAEVLAVYSDGEPAVTMSSFGKGKAILIGSYVGLPFHRLGHSANGDFIASLVDHATTIPRPRVVGRQKVRVDLLTNDAGEISVVLQNLSGEMADVAVEFPEVIDVRLTEIFDGEVVTPVRTANGSLLTTHLEAGEVRVYHG